MFRPLTLFHLFGIPIRIEFSWLLLLFLMVWSLSTGLFPSWYEQLPQETYLWMGIGGALGMFLSILAHEIAHAWVARLYQIPIRSIVLFIFGGIAEMEKEPPTAKSEFFIALAGPVASGFCGVAFGGLYLWGLQRGWAEAGEGVLLYLALVNGALAILNLLPAFPLDGGRVLRAILWGWRKDLVWSTRIVTSLGQGFGFLLILFAIVSLLAGQRFWVAIWWLLIGFFLRSSSQRAYQSLLMREMLRGEPIRKLLPAETLTVPATLSVQDFVDKIAFRYPHGMFPVLSPLDGSLLGSVSTEDLIRLPPSDWGSSTIRMILKPCSPTLCIPEGADALDAINQMNQSQTQRLFVVADEGKTLVGVLSIGDIFQFLAWKAEAEGVAHQKRPPSGRAE